VLLFNHSDLTAFSAKDQAVVLFVQAEKQKAMVNELVAKLTDSCWDKCMGTPGSKLSSGESACFTNCAQRFLETSQLILQKFERMQQG
jgi:import inner membrane translocase subunit TIM8